ncbi:MAG: hypothetical protein A4S12_05910 [Proteobacteria bacterium SG_bin5]|nr:phosphonoacetaldehyde methylase [Sphingomonas sp.]OQW43006.1 MAG: hypothetical protein A4S12_05910 [Proteobacteria bacterium SG_bin5]
MSHVHQNPIPEGALTLMGLIVVTALAITTGARVFQLPPAAQPAALRAADGGAVRVAERQLRFADRADGAVVISDAASGRLVKLEARNSNSGFIRGVLRGFARDRRMRGIGPAAPFTLTLWRDGQLTFTDPATGRSAELGGFGETNRAAFLALLTAKEA